RDDPQARIPGRRVLLGVRSCFLHGCPLQRAQPCKKKNLTPDRRDTRREGARCVSAFARSFSPSPCSFHPLHLPGPVPSLAGSSILTAALCAARQSCSWTARPSSPPL